MDDEDNPWRPRNADRDQTPPSTCGSTLNATSPRKPPAKIRDMIAKLGLRYRPLGGVAADLQAHGASIALLAADLADMPPDYLDRAIAQWVRTERWMPKASQLIALCQADQRAEIEGNRGDPGRSARDSAEAFCNSRNAMLQSGNHPREDAADLEWYVDGADQPQLRYKRKPAGGVEPIHPGLVAARNASLAKLNAVFRYADTGHARDLTADEELRRIERGGPRFGPDGRALHDSLTSRKDDR